MRFMMAFTLLEMMEAKGIHRPGKDVAVDVHRVVCLFQFDNQRLPAVPCPDSPVSWKMFFNRPIMTSLPRMEVLKYTSVFCSFISRSRSSLRMLFSSSFSAVADIVIDLFQIFQEPYGGGVNDP